MSTESIRQNVVSSSIPPISQIPVELLQEIANFLPIEAKACFSLTCKSVLHTIGKACWTDSAITDRIYSSNDSYSHYPRSIFLDLLSRDSKEWVFCSGCSILHPATKPPHQFTPKKDMKVCLAPDGMIDYFPRSGQKGYVLLLEHVRQALSESFNVLQRTGPPIELMSGSYMVNELHRFRPMVNHSLEFSARRVDKNLVFKHEHRFEARSKYLDLKASDVLDLPIRICPHHSTTAKSFRATDDVYWSIERRKWTRTKYNGPMMTHVITTAFPSRKRYSFWSWFRFPTFRKPTLTEENQMKAKREENDHWWCRSCPTKFQVRYEDGALVVTVWQNFGKTYETAKKAFTELVRRERIVKKVRINYYSWSPNSEYDHLSTQFVDFRCE